METVFPDRTKPPGLNDRLKLWWVKEVTPDYHVAGRLSERQIKYAAEGGFKSILSLFVYSDTESGDFGGDYLPTTKESTEICENKCGIQFAAVLFPDDDWCSVDAVKKMAAVLPKLKKPILLYSDRSDTVTFVLLMHFANCTHQDPKFEPNITSERFYKMSASMGFNFTIDSTKKVVAEITGEPIVQNPPIVNTEPEYWLDYWLGHPVYKNWHIGGQITPSHLKKLVNAGFKSVINMRPGLIFNGKPSQEEVNLLNIPEETGTYETDNQLQRQRPGRLEETRVDRLKSNSYVSDESKVNYEVKNEEEFGDEIGYNEELERKAFETCLIEYHHFPVLSSGPWEEYFEEHLKTFIDIGRKGPVLVQCARATRASYLAILCAAMQHGLSYDWALQKSRDLGFAITKQKPPQIHAVLNKYLGNKN